MQRSTLYIHRLGTASAAGIGLAALRRTLFEPESTGMRFHSGLAPEPTKPYYCGLLPELKFDSKNDRTKQLLDLCLSQINDLQDLLSEVADERIAVVLGACTAGMHSVESGMLSYVQQQVLPDGFNIRELNLFEPARYVASRINAKGPVYTISNACASGLMAVESAAALLRADLADIVITGGCDGFCQFTNAGFSSLSAVSAEPCAPFDENRKGINLGEGGALMVLSRSKKNALFAFSGMGLSTDAYHLSAPEPNGTQASFAMRQAVESAGISPEDIDLIIAHGTGTSLNDAMEARAIHDVFGNSVPCASYKALSGHTLAGAGALQVAIAAALLCDNPEGKLAPSAGIRTKDPNLADIRVLTAQEQLGRALNHIVVNAFAFGGSNASAVFSRVQS